MSVNVFVWISANFTVTFIISEPRIVQYIYVVALFV